MRRDAGCRSAEAAQPDPEDVAPDGNGTAVTAAPLEERPAEAQAAALPAPAGPSWLIQLSGHRRWWLPAACWGVLLACSYVIAGDRLNPYLSLTGLLVGFLVGLTGMGGGALMTPVLIFVFGFKPTLAIGTDITYGAVTKWFGAWRHWRQGSVDLPLTFYLALGSVPSTLLGVGLVHLLEKVYGAQLDNLLYRLIGAALVAVGVTLVLRSVFLADVAHRRENVRLSLRRKLVTIGLGAATGFVVGLTSVGSGTFLAMFLLIAYPLAASRVVGTDVFHAAILLGAAAVAQASIGNVDPWMVASLLLGSIPGVVIGSGLTIHTPNRLLRICLATVLFLSGIALFGKA
jgi:uncharacterized membrane protein YfcA